LTLLNSLDPTADLTKLIDRTADKNCVQNNV
jgi:hypothetical protein